MLWTLRYKQPMGVKVCTIETETEKIEDAEALGKWFVLQQPGPAYRFISVEKAIVARTADMRKGSIAESTSVPKPPSANLGEATEAGESVNAGRVAGAKAAGRVGA